MSLRGETTREGLCCRMDQWCLDLACRAGSVSTDASGGLCGDADLASSVGLARIEVTRFVELC